jgi:ATP-dependent DNA helicase RecG
MESQQIEWKEAWHDDYMKWICGFANAQGGTLVIGKDDKGKVVRLNNVKKLMEDLPNKIRSAMGIVVDVNLCNENGLAYIEIVVPAYQNAISYHSKYYLRTGSTNQELSGYALDELLFKKYGRTYDSMPLPSISMGDFWHDAFDLFRKKAIASKRLTDEDVAISDAELLQSLHLMENNYILLAATLVFHQTPQRWSAGAYVKIGYFTDNAEILYQDELNGAIVGMADKVVETIFIKYFIGLIRYEGLQRIDDYPMPRAALREAVMNALVHRDYSTGSPVQIRVYDNRVTIANDCRLPEGTTLSGLINAHKSVSINPLLTGAIFRSGQIEAWGRGIERIIKLCVADHLPEPEFFITPRTFTICFHTRDNHRNDLLNEDINESINEAVNEDNGVNEEINEDVNGVNEEINEEIKLSEREMTIIDIIKHNNQITQTEIAKKIKAGKSTIYRDIEKLKKQGLLKRLGSNKNGHWIIWGC